MRVADLPGLIEGASSNRGLGHAFLKHTEKAKALALVVSRRLGGKKKKIFDIFVRDVHYCRLNTEIASYNYGSQVCAWFH